jgi:hypothetical protein
MLPVTSMNMVSRFCGVDISAEMVERARRLTPSVEFRQGDEIIEHSSLVKNGRHLLGSVDDVNVIEFVTIKLNERSMIS